MSKLEAAERQLREAVRLFLEDRDPVATHTLAAAARDVLHDLARRRGETEGSLLEAVIRTHLRPERQSEVRDAIRRAQNFFKHADRGSGEDLEYDPQAAELFLLDAVLLHRKLSGGRLLEGVLFELWFAANRPELLAGDDLRRAVEEIQRRAPATKEFLLRSLTDPVLRAVFQAALTRAGILLES